MLELRDDDALDVNGFTDGELARLDRCAAARRVEQRGEPFCDLPPEAIRQVIAETIPASLRSFLVSAAGRQVLRAMTQHELDRRKGRVD